jgi:fibronectin type III domain-containing protein
LFGLNGDKITVETAETSATVTFSAFTSKTVPSPEYYVFEVSKDSLYEGVENANIIKFGEDKTLTSSPVVLSGLDGDSKYYMRVKAMSSTVNESKWVYYKDGSSFKTKAEQIFNNVEATDLFEDHVNLSWTPGADVTHITYANANDAENIQTINLTDEEKAAGKYTLAGLQPTSTYTITIYKNDVKRGQLQITTPAAMPAADYKYSLASDVTVISQTLIDEIAEQAKAKAGNATNYSATIGIPAGAKVALYGTNDSDGGKTNVTIPDGMSVTFFGLAGGETPTITLDKNFDVAGSHAFIKFQNVKLEENGASYFINQSKACTVSEFTLEDCEVSNIKNSFFRLQGSDAKSISKLTLKNSIFTKLCAGYGFIHIDAKSGAGHLDNVKIDGCTFNSICVTGKVFIYSNNTDMQDITIKNSTFYNCNGNGQFFVDFGKDAKFGPNTFTIESCIFGKSADEKTDKNIRSKTPATVANSFRTTDFFKVIKGVNDTEFSSEQLFTDPANGNFTIKAGTLKEKAGDPRWYAVED